MGVFQTWRSETDSPSRCVWMWDIAGWCLFLLHGWVSVEGNTPQKCAVYPGQVLVSFPNRWEVLCLFGMEKYNMKTRQVWKVSREFWHVHVNIHSFSMVGQLRFKTTNIKIVNMKSKMTLFIFLIHIPDLKGIVHLKTKRNPYNWLLLNIRDHLMNIHLGEFNTIQDIASHFNAWLMNINVAITLRCSQRWISEHLKFTFQCFWKRFQKCMQSTSNVQSVLA